MQDLFEFHNCDEAVLDSLRARALSGWRAAAASADAAEATALREFRRAHDGRAVLRAWARGTGERRAGCFFLRFTVSVYGFFFFFTLVTGPRRSVR